MSQEIAIIATNARPIGPNMTYVREETITVSEPLTDAERLEYGQEMADALAKKPLHGYAILVKGSRGIMMEKAIPAL